MLLILLSLSAKPAKKLLLLLLFSTNLKNLIISFIKIIRQTEKSTSPLRFVQPTNCCTDLCMCSTMK